MTTPLYAFVHRSSGERAYSIDPQWSRSGYDRQPQPLCRVWKVSSEVFQRMAK
jgi:hypothetical protein